MACPTCSGTMHSLGCRTTDRPFFWCPRCGTIKPCDTEHSVPALVDRCRTFEDKYVGRGKLFNYWHQLGIRESIRWPEDRP